MVQLVRKPVHTACGRISDDSDHEGMDTPQGYSNRSGQRPRRREHPGIDYSRIRQTESREVEVGRKRHSIDLRDNDRGVTSFVVSVCDEAGCHLAIVGVSLRELTVGVPWLLLGKCGKETLEPNDEQGILMVGWSGAGV